MKKVLLKRLRRGLGIGDPILEKTKRGDGITRLGTDS